MGLQRQLAEKAYAMKMAGLTKLQRHGIISVRIGREVKEYIQKYSIDHKMSERNEEYVRALGKTVAKVMTRFPEDRVLIAGGSIRDIVCGTGFNDIDLFFEAHNDDEDFVDLFWNYFKEEQGDIANRMGWANRVSKDGYVSSSIGQNNRTPFEVFEMTIPPQTDYYPWMIFQMISGVEGDPSEWMEKSFDYSLVRAAYDPLKEDFIFSPSFVASMETGRVPISDKKTEKRYRKFTSHKKLKFRARLDFKEEAEPPMYTGLLNTATWAGTTTDWKIVSLQNLQGNAQEMRAFANAPANQGLLNGIPIRQVQVFPQIDQNGNDIFQRDVRVQPI